MNPEIQAYYNELVEKMREGLRRFPHIGIALILKAERDTIMEDAETTAIWAEQEGKLRGIITPRKKRH